MNRDLARAVLARLRPAREPSTAKDLRQFGVREWQQTLDWLVDSDLALYFLRHLQISNETGIIPPQTLCHLETCFKENQARWERLAEVFERITEARVYHIRTRLLPSHSVNLLPSKSVPASTGDSSHMPSKWAN